MSDFDNRMECLICDGYYDNPGYTATTACDKCGAQYTYEEGVRITEESLAKLAAMSRPIAVSERLPEVDESTQSLNISSRVLVFCTDLQTWIIGRYSHNTDKWLDEIQLVTIGSPSHWLPMPTAPCW